MTTPYETEPTQTKHPRRWGKILGLTVLAVAVIGGASAVTAHRGGFGHGGFHHGPFDPDTAKERIEFVSGFVLSKIDATEEQQAQIQAILEATVDDLSGVAAEHRDGREAFHAALVQPAIDRQALEELRSRQLALAEQASRRLVTTIADVAEVLTPEQRVALAELVERHHGG